MVPQTAGSDEPGSGVTGVLPETGKAAAEQLLPAVDELRKLGAAELVWEALVSLSGDGPGQPLFHEA